MRDSDLEDDPQRAHTPELSEQTIADAIVDVVCRCGPPRHSRGYPECHVARGAASIVLRLVEKTGAERYLEERLKDPEYRQAYEGASERVNFPTNIHYGCVDCGSLNHTAGSVWCKS